MQSVVQLGGLEPPTSGSTIRRSNQLSYSCIVGGVETRTIGPVWQATVRPAQRDRQGPKSVKPGPEARASEAEKNSVAEGRDQATFLKALVTPVLIGSTVSVVTFWARAVSSLDCAAAVSNC